jgi:flagellar basal body-associated protein FliL
VNRYTIYLGIDLPFCFILAGKNRENSCEFCGVLLFCGNLPPHRYDGDFAWSADCIFLKSVFIYGELELTVMRTPVGLIDRALVIIILFLVFVIAVTTVWALLFRDSPDHREPAAVSETAVNGVVEQTFAGIGRLRAVLQKEPGKNGATVIVRVVFPYNAADRAFTEELVKNTGDFRETITAYFAGLTVSDPKLHDEAAIKTDLLERFNLRLRLGKIDRLFFSEFLIIE